MLCAIHSAYLEANKIKDATPEEWAQLRPLIQDGPATVEEALTRRYLHTVEIVDLDQDWPILSKFGLEVRIKRFRGQTPASMPRAIAEAPGFRDSGTVHVHLPNLGMLSMNEVMNLDDVCTDELQRHLDDGWRILCVCPPLNQRRPDYILGRSKGTRDDR